MTILELKKIYENYVLNKIIYMDYIRARDKSNLPIKDIIKLEKEIDNKMKENKGHIHCPVNGWDCPYFDANGCCMMYPDSDPWEECDDFAYFWDKDDDFICYDDHEGE